MRRSSATGRRVPRMESAGTSERCTWCGATIEREDGWRLAERAGERRAAFCRLEHVVPWSLQGARWEPGSIVEASGIDEHLEECSHCGESLPDVQLLLV